MVPMFNPTRSRGLLFEYSSIIVEPLNPARFGGSGELPAPVRSGATVRNCGLNFVGSD